MVTITLDLGDPEVEKHVMAIATAAIDASVMPLHNQVGRRGQLDVTIGELDHRGNRFAAYHWTTTQTPGPNINGDRI